MLSIECKDQKVGNVPLDQIREKLARILDTLQEASHHPSRPFHAVGQWPHQWKMNHHWDWSSPQEDVANILTFEKFYATIAHVSDFTRNGEDLAEWYNVNTHGNLGINTPETNTLLDEIVNWFFNNISPP